MKFNKSIVNPLQNDLVETLENDPLIGLARDLEEDEEEVEGKEADIQTTEEEAMVEEQNLEAIRKKRGGKTKNVWTRHILFPNYSTGLSEYLDNGVRII